MAYLEKYFQLEGKVGVGTTADPAHPQTSKEANLSLLKDQDGCDVVFLVGPDQVPVKCHKWVLKARSPVFQAQFSERWDSGSNLEAIAEVVLPEENPEAFQTFIQFIYGDKFTPNPSNFMDILQLAHLYEVLPLVRECEEVMMKCYKNMDATIEIYKTALKYSPDLDGLAGKIELFIARNILAFMNHRVFQSMDECMLMQFLSRKNLPVDETILFRLIRRWAEIQRRCNPELKEVDDRGILVNLIPLIRFPSMSLEEFANEVVPTKLLPVDQTLDIYIYLTSRTMREEVSRRIPFPKEIHGMERTVELYQQRRGTQEGRPRFKLAGQPYGQTDTLRFTFETGQVYQPWKILTWNGLILHGPLVGTFSPSVESYQRQDAEIIISYIDAARKPSTVCSLRAKLKAGVEKQLDIPSIELVHGRRYVISVTIKNFVPILADGAANISNSFDINTLTTLKSNFEDVNKFGNYKLTSIDSSTRTLERFKGSSWGPAGSVFGMHVVRGLRLAYVHGMQVKL